MNYWWLAKVTERTENYAKAQKRRHEDFLKAHADSEEMKLVFRDGEETKQVKEALEARIAKYEEELKSEVDLIRNLPSLARSQSDVGDIAYPLSVVIKRMFELEDDHEFGVRRVLGAADADSLRRDHSKLVAAGRALDDKFLADIMELNSGFGLSEINKALEELRRD